MRLQKGLENLSADKAWMNTDSSLVHETEEVARIHVVKFLDGLKNDLSDDHAMLLANEIKAEARSQS